MQVELPPVLTEDGKCRADFRRYHSSQMRSQMRRSRTAVAPQCPAVEVEQIDAKSAKDAVVAEILAQVVYANVGGGGGGSVTGLCPESIEHMGGARSR